MRNMTKRRDERGGFPPLVSGYCYPISLYFLLPAFRQNPATFATLILEGSPRKTKETFVM